MPFYDYRCRKCDKTFDVRCSYDDKDIPCPGCNSIDTERLVSAPAAVNCQGCPGYNIKWVKNADANIKAMKKDYNR